MLSPSLVQKGDSLEYIIICRDLTLSDASPKSFGTLSMSSEVVHSRPSVTHNLLLKLESCEYSGISPLHLLSDVAYQVYQEETATSTLR